MQFRFWGEMWRSHDLEIGRVPVVMWLGWSCSFSLSVWEIHWFQWNKHNERINGFHRITSESRVSKSLYWWCHFLLVIRRDVNSFLLFYVQFYFQIEFKRTFSWSKHAKPSNTSAFLFIRFLKHWTIVRMFFFFRFFPYYCWSRKNCQASSGLNWIWSLKNDLY